MAYNGEIWCKLTNTKMIADVRFTRMHCGRKSFKKANRRLLKDSIRQEVNFFVVVTFFIIR